MLSSSLDLLDLSEPGERRRSKDRKSPMSSKSTPHRKKADETELIQVDVEQNKPSSRTPVKDSLDSGIQVMGRVSVKLSINHLLHLRNISG